MMFFDEYSQFVNLILDIVLRGTQCHCHFHEKGCEAAVRCAIGIVGIQVFAHIWRIYLGQRKQYEIINKIIR